MYVYNKGIWLEREGYKDFKIKEKNIVKYKVGVDLF